MEYSPRPSESSTSPISSSSKETLDQQQQQHLDQQILYKCKKIDADLQTSHLENEANVLQGTLAAILVPLGVVGVGEAVMCVKQYLEFVFSSNGGSGVSVNGSGVDVTSGGLDDEGKSRTQRLSDADDDQVDEKDQI
ncbi:UNVERIFIED_CONTAM: hypothetical protein HDU68_008853 [Siphonaria sp. JEL0065]|nr:hypothetical protein HDU68_008853 [Siphonaria sp. JEL0065]